MLVKWGKRRFAWTTALPGVFVAVTTLTAAYQMIANHYWPKTATPFMIHFNIALIVLMVACSLIIFVSAVRKIFVLWRPAEGQMKAQ